MKTFANWFLALGLMLALLVAISPSTEAQRGSGILKQQTLNEDEETLVINNLSDVPTFGINVVNAGTYQLNFEASIDGGTTWVQHFCTINDGTLDTDTITVAPGTFFCSNPGLTNFRVRVESYTNGAPVVTISRGYSKGGGLSAPGLEIPPAIDDGAVLVNNAGELDNYGGTTCASGSFVSALDQFGASTCGAGRTPSANNITGFYPTGFHYILGGQLTNAAVTTLQTANGRADLIPYRPDGTVTFDRLSIYTTTGVGSATVKILVYSAHATTGWPDSLLFESDSLACDTTNTNSHDTTGLPAFTVGSMYWVGVIGNSTCTLRSQTAAQTVAIGIGDDPTQSPYFNVVRLTGLTYASPPATWTFNENQLVNANAPWIIGRAP